MSKKYVKSRIWACVGYPLFYIKRVVVLLFFSCQNLNRGIKVKRLCSVFIDKKCKFIIVKYA